MEKESNMIFLSAGRYGQLIKRELAYNTIVNATSALLYSKSVNAFTEYEQLMSWFINTMIDLEV